MTPRRARLRSLAKINLDLRVLHKNPDGFHELRTVFHTISLADTIEISCTPSRRTKITLDDPHQIPDNLVVRAAQAVLEAGKIHAQVDLRLKKKIPMGGGLGGGSSNAAAILLALPVLAGKNLSFETLHTLAAQLGSDVPFFLTGGAALGLGRGTELYPLPDLSEDPLLIVTSGLHVATGPAYQALNRSLTFTGTSSSINSFQAFVRALEVSRSAGVASALGSNDFEAVVFTQYPQLKSIQGRLSSAKLCVGVKGSRMTGSGSAIFGIFGSIRERDRASKVLAADRVFEGCKIMSASLVNRARYVRLWKRQLAEHVLPLRSLRNKYEEWPPRSRYAQ